MHGLSIDTFPVSRSFIVGHGIEEGFAKGSFRVERLGFMRVGRGWRAGTMTAVTMAMTPVGVVTMVSFPFLISVPFTVSAFRIA